MKRNCQIGLELRDGFDVGRDPRARSADELALLNHARVSPLRALRMKCLDCCNDSAQEVRLCTAVGCPNWPFRMGKNPWLTPLGDAERARRSAMMRRNRASAAAEPVKSQGQIGASGFDGGEVPEGNAADFPHIKLDVEEGGAA